MLKHRTELLAVAFVLGLALRIVALQLPGATDGPIFSLWADTAASEGIGRIYGTGGEFPDRRLLERGEIRTKVNYPPLLLYEFIAVRMVRLPLKALSLVADLFVALLLWHVSRNRSATPLLAYWLNPATVLTGSVLGYVEPLMAAPAVAAIVSAASGRPLLAGILSAASLATKQNAVLALPATLMAVILIPHAASVRTRATRFLGGAFLVAAAVSAQICWLGGALNMIRSLASPLRDPFLSGNAANLWWLVGKMVPAVPLDPCRALGGAAVLVVVAWTVVAAPRPVDLWVCAAAAALSFHAYHVLAVSAHEAHLFPAVPLLALAAVARPVCWRPFAVVSAIAALNLDVFYGLGMDAGHLIPRAIGRIETASLLAVLNCAALAWHLRLFAREARTPGLGRSDLGGWTTHLEPRSISESIPAVAESSAAE